MPEIIVALDLPSHTAALGLVDELGDAVSWYKLGSPLFTRHGPAFARQLRDRGKNVFLDLKFHDIPNTVANSVEAAAALDVQLITVHASGGRPMLEAAAKAAGTRGPRLLAVTLLTSLGTDDVAEIWGRPVTIQEEVLRLASAAHDAGIHGVVSSPLETAGLRKRLGPDAIIVNPGIRPVHGQKADQVRTATPAAAARAGADYLVIGRPILEASDRIGAVAAIRTELAEVASAA